MAASRAALARWVAFRLLESPTAARIELAVMSGLRACVRSLRDWRQYAALRRPHAALVARTLRTALVQAWEAWRHRVRAELTAAGAVARGRDAAVCEAWMTWRRRVCADLAAVGAALAVELSASRRTFAVWAAAAPAWAARGRAAAIAWDHHWVHTLIGYLRCWHERAQQRYSAKILHMLRAHHRDGYLSNSDWAAALASSIGPAAEISYPTGHPESYPTGHPEIGAVAVEARHPAEVEVDVKGEAY